jgi:hypothetical protein
MQFVLSVSACSGTEEGKNSNPLNSTYWIEGRGYDLKDGKCRVESGAGEKTFITTSVYGPYAKGDLNGDGVPDIGLILEQEADKGDAIFYAVAAVKSGEQYKGSHAALLGEDIVPNSIEIEDCVMTVGVRGQISYPSAAAGVSVERSFRMQLNNDRLEFLNP